MNEVDEKPGTPKAEEVTQAVGAVPAPPLPEGVEKVPELHLTVAGPCNNPSGRYVGLNQWQREQLAVAVGETVELFSDDGASIGVFTVGTGSKKLLNKTDVFTANVDSAHIEKVLTVKARKLAPESPMELNVQHMAEKADKEKDARRRDIIEHRLKLDPAVYVTIPTPVAALLGIKAPQGQTIAPISSGKIRGLDGKDCEIAFVPTGSSIGFTSEAAKKLGIPPQLEKIRIRVDNGVLVNA